MGFGTVGIMNVQSVELACAVGAFINPNARVLSVTILLAFYAPNRDTEVLYDIDQLIINVNTSCEEVISNVRICTCYLECSGCLVR